MTPERISGLSVLFLVVAAAVLTWVKFGYEPALFYVAGCGGAFLIGVFMETDGPTYAEMQRDFDKQPKTGDGR